MAIAGTSAISVDRALIEETQYSERLDEPFVQHYLSINEDKVTANIALDKLVLKLNKQVIPLQLMAAGPLKMPLTELVKMVEKY